MSIGAVLSFACGILGPVALVAACVFEFISRRILRDPRHDMERLEKPQKYADVTLVAAWLLLAAAYVIFQYMTPDSTAWAESFQTWMSWMMVALLVLDILYLYLRRSRPRPAGKRKHFWEYWMK